MNNNGTRPRCGAPICNRVVDYIVTYDGQSYCDYHIEEFVQRPAVKLWEATKASAERAAGIVNKINNAIKQAKERDGSKPPPITYHCHNLDKGCPFTALTTKHLKVHEDSNCKFNKAKKISQPRKAGAPKASKAPLSAQMMSDE